MWRVSLPRLWCHPATVTPHRTGSSLSVEQLGPDTTPAVSPPSEVTEIHSRLLRCSLCPEESRAYWSNVDPDRPRESAARAFELSWFGAKSEPWTTELLSNMRLRFDAFTEALRVL